MSGALLRLSLPLPGGQIPAAARAIGAATLVSANALARYRDVGGVRTFAGFRHDLPDLAGLDCALDSAGFTAWAHYGGFPWCVEDYVELAGARPWAWWAQMDACCEPEIARTPAWVRVRQAETIRLLGECEAVARRRGVVPPVPVLQGWTPDDYAWHAEQLYLADRPLVGVGSMCRRNLHGPAGLLAVLDALDAVLPAACKLHLFGVKGSALAVLGHHRRVASVDSMAWDAAARRRHPTGRTMALRGQAMREWHDAQQAAIARRQASQAALWFPSGQAGAIPESVGEWCELIASGEIDAQGAWYFVAQDLAWGCCDA